MKALESFGYFSLSSVLTVRQRALRVVVPGALLSVLARRPLLLPRLSCF